MHTCKDILDANPSHLLDLFASAALKSPCWSTEIKLIWLDNENLEKDAIQKLDTQPIMDLRHR